MRHVTPVFLWPALWHITWHGPLAFPTAVFRDAGAHTAFSLCGSSRAATHTPLPFASGFRAAAPFLFPQLRPLCYSLRSFPLAAFVHRFFSLFFRRFSSLNIRFSTFAMVYIRIYIYEQVVVGLACLSCSGWCRAVGTYI